MTHSFVTIAIPFRVGCSDAVEQQLDDLGRPEGGRMEHVRRRLDATELVHFMSITVVRGDKCIGGLPDVVDDHPDGPSFIIMEVSVDGGAEPALAAIATAMAADLDALLAAAGVDIEDAALAEFLSRHRIEIGQGWFSTPGLAYDGTPDMTVRRIRREDNLAQRIAQMVDRPVTGTTALGILEAVRKQLWAESEKWAFVADPTPSLQVNPFSKWRARFGTALSAVRNFLWPFVLAALLPTAVFLLSLLNAGLRASWFTNFQKTVWITVAVIAIEAAIVLAAYLLLRRREKWDPSEDIAPASAHVERLMKRKATASEPSRRRLVHEAGAAATPHAAHWPVGRRHDRAVRVASELPRQDRRHSLCALASPARHQQASVHVELRRSLGNLSRGFHRGGA